MNGYLCDDASDWSLAAKIGYAQIDGRWRIAFREQGVEQETEQEITAPARPLAEASLRLLMYFVPMPSAEEFCRTIEASR